MPLDKNVAPVASTDAMEVVTIETHDPWSKLLASTPNEEDNSAADARKQTAAQASSSGANPGQPPASNSYKYSIEIDKLSFSYPGLDGRPLSGVPPVVQEMTANLEPGSRCLLIGPNGAGKTTLLKTLGGKHMVPKESLRILGQPPFHTTHLTTSGALSYIGGNWERDVAFAGYAVPLAGDFPASQMLDSIPHVDPARKKHLQALQQHGMEDVNARSKRAPCCSVVWTLHGVRQC